MGELSVPSPVLIPLDRPAKVEWKRQTTSLVYTFGKIQRLQSTAQAPIDPPSVFATHHVPEDEVNAAREAIRQAGIMMEKMKTVRDTSQAAYDASSSLQSNV